MKLKMLLTTTALVLAPALAANAACYGGHEKQAMSCAEGSQYDEAKGECVVISS